MSGEYCHQNRAASDKNRHQKGCEAPIVVNADKEKIRQVLLNLFENAIKYGKKNGSIKVGVYATDDKRILVEISDDGVGISSKSLPAFSKDFTEPKQGVILKLPVAAWGWPFANTLLKHIIRPYISAVPRM